MRIRFAATCRITALLHGRINERTRFWGEFSVLVFRGTRRDRSCEAAEPGGADVGARLHEAKALVRADGLVVRTADRINRPRARGLPEQRRGHRQGGRARIADTSIECTGPKSEITEMGPACRVAQRAAYNCARRANHVF